MIKFHPHNFTNPAWTRLVGRFNSLFPDDKDDEILAPPVPPVMAPVESPAVGAVPMFQRPRMLVRESDERKRTEENEEEKPIIFNRPRMSSKDGASWIKREI